MSPESCSKVSSTAGKLCHVPLRQSRQYQPRACFLFRLSLRVDPFLRWPALISFSSTHRFQLGKILSANLYSNSIYRRKNWTFWFEHGVVVCWLFFSFEVVDYVFCTYVLVLLRGTYCFSSLGDPHTHLARVLLWRASLHTDRLAVGGWCWCWWDQPAHAPSDVPSKPITHQLTPIYPYPPSHHARFLRRRASLNNGNDPKTIAGTE